MKTKLIVLLTSLTLCAGCAFDAVARTVEHHSTLGTYLFGGAEAQHPAQKVPLTFPARVGVTFVPGDPALALIPETTKKEIIETVRSQLASHTRYVAGAQNIPTSYLIPKGGVSNLEQVARQFDVDVIVLLGASQLQKYERHPFAAFMDLSIIGSFVIPGNKVNTATVLEAAVYHVPSRALIFRADGTDETASRSTLYGSMRVAQDDAVTSVGEASRKLTASIGKALVQFEKFDASKAQEIKQLKNGDTTADEKSNYWGRVSEYRSTGGGSFDVAWISLAGMGLVCAAINRRKQ